VNNQRINDKNLILHENDEVLVFDSNQVQKRVELKPVSFTNLKVVYEDDNLLIVDKPANIEVHSEFNDSLDDMVRSYLHDKGEYNPDQEQSFVVSHIHRLDKLTSGLVIYAKNKASANVLLTAIQNKNQIEKYYLLETQSGFPESLKAEGSIFYDQNAQRSFYQDKIKENKPGVKSAITEFKLLETLPKASLVEAKLITGRKHQIRATLAFYQFPILNDFKYGGKKLNHERMIFLKAYRLIFKDLPEPLSYLNETEIKLKPEFE
jgi:23S rRNA pseudouridine955/2504/2580 synthase